MMRSVLRICPKIGRHCNVPWVIAKRRWTPWSRLRFLKAWRRSVSEGTVKRTRSDPEYRYPTWQAGEITTVTLLDRVFDFYTKFSKQLLQWLPKFNPIQWDITGTGGGISLPASCNQVHIQIGCILSQFTKSASVIQLDNERCRPVSWIFCHRCIVYLPGPVHGRHCYVIDQCGIHGLAHLYRWHPHILLPTCLHVNHAQYIIHCAVVRSSFI